MMAASGRFELVRIAEGSALIFDHAGDLVWRVGSYNQGIVSGELGEVAWAVWSRPRPARPTRTESMLRWDKWTLYERGLSSEEAAIAAAKAAAG